MALYFLQGGVFNQGTNLNARFKAVTYLQAAYFGSKFFNKVVVNTILHVNAVGAHACLARVAVFAGHGTVNGRVDVGIVKHNKRCIAAQLQRHFFNRGCALRHQNSPHLCRAGKADVPHHFALAQGFANGNAARFIGCDDVEHTCRNACAHGQFARSQG